MTTLSRQIFERLRNNRLVLRQTYQRHPLLIRNASERVLKMLGLREPVTSQVRHVNAPRVVDTRRNWTGTNPNAPRSEPRENFKPSINAELPRATLPDVPVTATVMAQPVAELPVEQNFEATLDNFEEPNWDVLEAQIAEHAAQQAAKLESALELEPEAELTVPTSEARVTSTAETTRAVVTEPDLTPTAEQFQTDPASPRVEPRVQMGRTTPDSNRETGPSKTARVAPVKAEMLANAETLETQAQIASDAVRAIGSSVEPNESARATEVQSDVQAQTIALRAESEPEHAESRAQTLSVQAEAEKPVQLMRDEAKPVVQEPRTESVISLETMVEQSASDLSVEETSTLQSSAVIADSVAHSETPNSNFERAAETEPAQIQSTTDSSVIAPETPWQRAQPGTPGSGVAEIIRAKPPKGFVPPNARAPQPVEEEFKGPPPASAEMLAALAKRFPKANDPLLKMNQVRAEEPSVPAEESRTKKSDAEESDAGKSRTKKSDAEKSDAEPTNPNQKKEEIKNEVTNAQNVTNSAVTSDYETRTRDWTVTSIETSVESTPTEESSTLPFRAPHHTIFNTARADVSEAQPKENSSSSLELNPFVTPATRESGSPPIQSSSSIQRRFIQPLPNSQPSSGSQPTSNANPRASSQPQSAPLSESTRQFVKPLIGIDVDAVRVHRTPETQRFLENNNADGAAVGHEIALPLQANESDPDVLGVIAHELAHVAQFSGVTPPALATASNLGEMNSQVNSSPEVQALQVERIARNLAEERSGFDRGVPINRVFVPPMTRTATPSQPRVFTNTARADITSQPAPQLYESEWNGLPAPWEPMPIFEARVSPSTTPNSSAETTVMPTATFSAPSGFNANTTQNAVQFAESSRDSDTSSSGGSGGSTASPGGGGQSSQPNMEALAKQVYGILKRRLQAERRREG